MNARNVIVYSSLRLIVVLAVAGAAPALAQSIVRSVNGPAANAQYGRACIVLPDQNNDGYKDLLVGAPGFNQERGAIYCLSGAFLASGNGAQTLWSLAPTANQGDLFGSTLADVGDVNSDGVGDFLVGQPGYDTTTANDVGAVRLVNGASHTVVSLIHGFAPGSLLGSALAATGDLNFDGRSEVLVGAPGPVGGLYLFEASTLLTNGNANLLWSAVIHSSSGAEFGASLASGFRRTVFGSSTTSYFVIGSPGADGPSATDAGMVRLGYVVGNSSGGWGILILASFNSTTPGERLGSSIDAAHDYDGDGFVDFVVGAPKFRSTTGFEVGRAMVFSGQAFPQPTSNPVLYTLPFGSNPQPPANHSDPNPNFHFGAAVRASADLNGDGVGEILVGAPDYFTAGVLSGWNFRGLVRVFSGASGQVLTTVTGASTDRLGDGLGGAIDDFDGDGFEEFIVAGSRSDAGGTDSGVVKCYRLFPLSPSTYCIGKVNSLGCTPAIGFSGVASASSGLPFQITCSNLVNQKNGLLFYSHRPIAALFQGGTLCVASPSIRTPSQNSGGATSGSSCSGVYSMDFNAWFASGIDPALAAGSEIYSQHWSRDPASPSHTSLSNALRFVINP
jgi:hypothetical protein